MRGHRRRNTESKLVKFIIRVTTRDTERAALSNGAFFSDKHDWLLLPNFAIHVSYCQDPAFAYMVGKSDAEV